MDNNDVLRRIRFIFDLDDKAMIATFAEGRCEVSRTEVSSWLKREDDPEMVACSDFILASFLNGFINKRRGRKEGTQPEAEKRLTNNIIFQKLKIALNLKSEDILELFEVAEFKVTKPELSAFFRKPGHKHYRACKDQMLRNFLKGLQRHYRDISDPAGDDEDEYLDEAKPGSAWDK